MASKSMLSFFCLLLVSSAIGEDITEMLSPYSDYSTFMKLLTDTKLVDEINSRQTVTVLVLDNSAVGAITSLPQAAQKQALSVHVILDYYDPVKLDSLKDKTAQLTTLYQASGQATGQMGFIKYAELPNEQQVFGSAVPGAPMNSNLIKVVAARPYNLSVMQVSTAIVPPGLSGAAKATPPTPSAQSPPPAQSNNSSSPSTGNSTPPSSGSSTPPSSSSNSTSPSSGNSTSPSSGNATPPPAKSAPTPSGSATPPPAKSAPTPSGSASTPPPTKSATPPTKSSASPSTSSSKATPPSSGAKSAPTQAPSGSATSPSSAATSPAQAPSTAQGPSSDASITMPPSAGVGGPTAGGPVAGGPGAAASAEPTKASSAGALGAGAGIGLLSLGLFVFGAM